MRDLETDPKINKFRDVPVASLDMRGSLETLSSVPRYEDRGMELAAGDEE